MKRLSMALFSLGLMALSTGCVTRTITSFEDNYTKPLTAVEVLKTENYLFYGKRTHQFYMCQDMGDKLVCKLSCDGANDAVCPAAGANGMGRGTNVR